MVFNTLHFSWIDSKYKKFLPQFTTKYHFVDKFYHFTFHFEQEKKQEMVVKIKKI